jgi:hypothetical protein
VKSEQREEAGMGMCVKSIRPVRKQSKRRQNQEKSACHNHQDIAEGSSIGPAMVFSNHMRLDADFVVLIAMILAFFCGAKERNSPVCVLSGG